MDEKQSLGIYSRDDLKRHLYELFWGIQQYVTAVFSQDEDDRAKASKLNILAYLGLQKLLTLELKASLTREGLSSVREITPHVLSSLEKMILNVSPGFIPESANETCIHVGEAEVLKEKRRKHLLGGLNQDFPAVMVTLDRIMLDTPDIFEDLLKAGMKIARINCAHDHFLVWEQMVKQIRMAEDKISKEEGLKHNRCKVYMDLAGPKIRITAFQNERLPSEIYIRKGDAESKGFITCGTLPSDLESDSFVLSISEEEIAGVQIKDTIHFTDKRGKKRFFKVLKVISSTCIQVELNKSSVLNEGTLLLWKNKQWSLSNYQEKAVTIYLEEGDFLRIYKSSDYLGRTGNKSMPASIGVTLPKALVNVKVNDRVFIDDGKISARVTGVEEDFITAKINFTQNKKIKLKSGKGINLPDSLVYLNTPALTAYDLETLPSICEIADIIGLSFVHHPNDLKKLKNYLALLTEKKIGVIAKIETQESVYHLTKIILEGLNFDSFGIMIARGDLTVEMGYKRLAAIQEAILHLCSAAHLPVIWATGVLENMTKKGMPSKTEITDIFMGLRADCIMLNKGPHIVDAVKLISEIKEVTQENLYHIRMSEREFIQYGF
ncbi:pyruvate kinase [Peribacillus deserti]|uniref:Pyruvate kinase n=1 Tax=Peribacillus deserti TaxID=673318 RepID=A0A2N5M440_9BACI|nr:pyruvate kinase [Peribacillus deserti]PLT29136.1 pyruvate kinase [Peribacillus deserti]